MSRRTWTRVAAAFLVWLALVGISIANQNAPQPHPSPSEPATARDVAASTVVPVRASPPAAGPEATASGPTASGPTASGPTASGPTASPGSGVATTSAIRPGSVNRTSLNLSATYDVTLRVGWSRRSFLAGTTIGLTNTSGVAIDRLELNTIAARLGGGLSIRSATVDGKTVSPTIADQTIKLHLGGILDPGASATVRLTYRATLRSTTSGSTWLFTRANGIIEAHRWIPWISRATAFDRPNHGDPFVTPVSPRVRVTIIGDRVLSWATTGEQVGPTGTTTRFEATNVRDFAIVGAPDFRLSSATVGGVTIRVKARPGFPSATVLSAAKVALGREATLLGAYPYPTYDLAQTAGGYGMESPGLTWIPTGAGSLGYLVAHETAHQWFYGIVGNDQARNPYADEAAADMVARNVLGLRRASRCSTARLDLTIYQYSSACYYEDIYIQGGNFLDDLRKSMGSTAYWQAIRDYLNANRFKLSTTQKLLAAIDAATPLDFRSRYHARFPSIF